MVVWACFLQVPEETSNLQGAYGLRAEQSQGNNLLLEANGMVGTMLSFQYVILSPHDNLARLRLYYPHFTDAKIEAQRD